MSGYTRRVSTREQRLAAIASGERLIAGVVRPPLRNVPVAAVAVALLGCGEQPQVSAAPTVTTATAVTAAAVQPGRFQLAQAPVAIYTGVPAPDCEFRV